MNRRIFIKNGLVLSTATLMTNSLLSETKNNIHSYEDVDISVVKSEKYFESAIKAVEMIGGMKKFVPTGSKVGILVNAPAWWTKPGSYTNTDVVLAAVKMCMDAGAKELVYLIELAPDFWERSQLSANYKDQIGLIQKNSGVFVEKIIKGKSLKKANMIRDLFECDVFINIPIAKHHAGTNFTCTLKNMMGACHSETNQFFHKGTGTENEFDEVKFLSQCIADVNLVRKPDLCIVDATEFLLTNGPWGPGELKKANTIVAGTDPVLVDSYCASFVGQKSEDILMIQNAYKHGLGKKDLSKAKIKEATI